MARIRQYGTINTLIGGLLDGTFAIPGLVQPGEIGLGTFHALNGELVILDGTCYQVLADGTVSVAGPSARTPFLTVGSFQNPGAIELGALAGFDALTSRLDDELGDLNRPALVQINGRFSRLKARSIHSQSKPYAGLAEVARTQEVFEWSSFEGTIVGVRFPRYLQVLQVAGWHLHALSSAATCGGHLLDLRIDSAQILLESAEAFTVQLPDDQAFRTAKLPIDVHAAVQDAERDPRAQNPRG